jgi:hypothetical protein
MAETFSALKGYGVLRPGLTPLVMGLVFASGGVMVYICLDELLLPVARCNGTHHQAIGDVVAGMVFKRVSLLLLA